MTWRLAFLLVSTLTVGAVFAQELPADHGLWPPAVFTSAYKLIATPGEQAALDTLQGDSRTQYLERFWKLRDPTPTTPQNEFREQFRERVEYALVWFRTVNIRDPWDERGMVYIKFGEPDERQDSVDHWYAPMDTAKATHQMPMSSSEVINPMERGDPNWFKRDLGEVWYYFGRNLVLQFQGDHLDYRLVPTVTSKGEYQPLFDFEEHRRKVSISPVAYLPPLGREELALSLAWYPFRREDGSYDVYFASALPIAALASSVGLRQYQYSYSAILSVYNERLDCVWLDSARTEGNLDRTSRKSTSLSGFSHVFPPGHYLVGAEVTSTDSIRHATASLSGWLVPYAEEVGLDLSPLIVAARIEDSTSDESFLVRNGKSIWPVPGAQFNSQQTVYFYHEVYNLGPDGRHRYDYRIRYTLFDKKRGTTKVLVDRTLESEISNTFHSCAIPSGTLQGGRYILEAKIDDLVTGKSKVALAALMVD